MTSIHINEKNAPQTATGRQATPAPRYFGLIMYVAIMAQIFCSLPTSLDFKLFAFYDPGATLKADWLTSAQGGGLIPSVDFSYSYGLLSLAAGKISFAILGRTPWAFWLLSSIGMFVMAAGMVRMAHAMQFSLSQKILLALSLPLAIPAYYLSLTHIAEAALLLHSLAEIAERRYTRALLLATIAALLKPSMAFILGFIVIILFTWCYRKRRQIIWLQFLPAATAAILLCLVIGVMFSWQALGNTLLPLTGGASYKAAGFGFFSPTGGRGFWLPQRMTDYLFTPSGWWVIATILTWLGALIAALRMLRGQKVAGGAVIITIALMHAAFIFLFYAWRDSWTYYSYLPALGLVTAWQLLPRKEWATLLLALLIGCGCIYRISMTIGEWAFKSRHSDTAGLWIYDNQLEDWRHFRQLDNERKTYWLVNGYVGQMFPGVSTPPSWWLSPALQNKKEIAAIRKEISDSDAVIRWAEHGHLDPWYFGELTDQTKQFYADERSEWFILEKRK